MSFNMLSTIFLFMHIKKFNNLFIIIVSIFIVYANVLLAQGENNEWHFGRKYALDFSQNPALLKESNIMTMEASSAVSDEQGNLLFYTMGSRVWDKNGDLMPNSIGMLGNGPFNPQTGDPIGSNNNGVAIVRNPANKNQYLVFCGDPHEVLIDPKVYYSIVDMTLNNGLGDVLPATKNQILMTNNSENMAVVKGADCNSFWIIVQELSTKNFYAFKIDATGVSNTPVITNFPGTGNVISQYTHFTFAPDGINVAVGGQRIFLGKFNNATGQFYDFTMLNNVSYQGNMAYSHDGLKLYVAAGAYGLLQFDLSLLPNITSVVGSLSIIYPGASYDRPYEVRLGPDNKIYTISITSGQLCYIGIIHNPTVQGVGCNFQHTAYAHPNWSPDQFFVSLGEPYIPGKVIDTIFTKKDTSICFENLYTATVSNLLASNYQWNTGDTTATITITTNGTYWVKSEIECTTIIDTFIVKFDFFEINLGNDTVICIENPFTINAYHSNINNYLWSTGDNTSSITISESGKYFVTASNGLCKASDTINVIFKNPNLFIKESDTTLCIGTSFIVNVISNIESDYKWNNGFSGSKIPITKSGTYHVIAQDDCGTFTDSITLLFIDCECNDLFIPNAFSPNDDGLNDIFKPIITCDVMRFYTLQIFNRYGQKVFETFDSSHGWDGKLNSKPTEVGVYFYYLKFSNNIGDVSTYKGELTLIR